MWKKLPEGYLVLYEKKGVVHITNYVKIWTKRFSDKDFLSILKNSNSGLEIDENELLRKGLQLLTNPEGLKSVKFEEDFSEKILNVTMTMSFGYPLKLKLKLKQDHQELFFMKVTTRLLQVIRDLRVSEEELLQLLLKKDKEIKEYKCEGGEIALRSLKTVPFNEEKHMSKHSAYSDNISLVVYEDLHEPETSEVKEEVNEANIATSEVKIDPTEAVKHECKSEPQSVDSELHDVKTELQSVKSEMSTESQASTTPNKKKRKKLNL